MMQLTGGRHFLSTDWPGSLIREVVHPLGMRAVFGRGSCTPDRKGTGRTKHKMPGAGVWMILIRELTFTLRMRIFLISR